MIENNENREICSACGGNCCKRFPGIVHPDEIEGGVTWDKIHEMVMTGRYAIDNGYFSPDNYDSHYLRPAMKGKEGQIYNESSYIECTFLTPDGCELSFEDRPFQCRALVPVAGKTLCNIGEFTKNYMIEQWAPYQDALKEHGNIVLNKSRMG